MPGDGAFHFHLHFSTAKPNARSPASSSLFSLSDHTNEVHDEQPPFRSVSMHAVAYGASCTDRIAGTTTGAATGRTSAFIAVG
jgi:hypothetical protein